MRIVKRINTNAVVCLDSRGREVVALGRGIGFPDAGNDVEVARIERTFYDVDARYLGLLDEIPLDVLSASAQIVDVIRAALPYELAPSFPLTLADHIAFMLKRAHEHLKVSMPFSYDLAQLYPEEFRLGRFTVERIERAFSVSLPYEEAAGVAMSILSAAVPGDARPAGIDIDHLLDQLVDVIERELAIKIDRDGVAFARFAMHVRYLVRGIHADSPRDAPGGNLLAALDSEYPQLTACADDVAALLGRALGCELVSGERVYIALHLNRLCAGAPSLNDGGGAVGEPDSLVVPASAASSPSMRSPADFLPAAAPERGRTVADPAPASPQS